MGERGAAGGIGGRHAIHILRRWFPKGTNFDQVTEAEVAQAAEWMNNYPRRILGWRSAGAVFEEYVAA